MKRPHVSLRLAACATVALMVGLACGQTPGNPIGGNVKEGGKITIASWQEEDTMLAAGITSASSHALAYEGPMMEGLLTLKATSDLPKNPKSSDFWAPQLATEVPTVENGAVKVNGDKMDVTWKLRQGVKWHDGEPFSSKDVKSTFDFWWLKYKDQNPTPVVATAGWDQVTGVDTPDDHTAIVHYGSIYGPYLIYGTGPYGILPDHLLQKTWSQGGDVTKVKLQISIPGGFNGSDTWDKWLVGTGPFMFKEWVSGDHMTMVKNPNYWGSKPHLDQIIIKFEPDTNTQLADLRTGTIDMGFDFRAALLSPLGHLANVKTDLIPDNGSEKLDVNLKNKYLSDPVIRKAILQGIDRQAIIDTLLQGKTTIPADAAVMCQGSGAWCQDPSVPKTKYDPEAAKKALDAAGYKLDSKTGVRTFKDGTPISISLQTTSGNALREQQEVVIANNLKSIGIDIKQPFQNPRSGKLFGSYASGGVLYNHTFDLAQYTNTVTAGDPDGWYVAYACDQIPTPQNGGVGQNTTQTCDPRLDAALKKGRGAVKQEDRKAAYVEAEKILAELLPEIPLYQQLTVNSYNTKITGYKPNPDWWLVNAENLALTG
jgi:peptide/nickel transport system substrate-binding protein